MSHVPLFTLLPSLNIKYTHLQNMSGSDTEARKELTSHFGAAVAEHPDVMSECKSYPTPISQELMNRPLNAPVIQPRPICFVLQIRSIRHVSSVWIEGQAVGPYAGDG